MKSCLVLVNLDAPHQRTYRRLRLAVCIVAFTLKVTHVALWCYIWTMMQYKVLITKQNFVNKSHNVRKYGMGHCIIYDVSMFRLITCVSYNKTSYPHNYLDHPYLWQEFPSPTCDVIHCLYNELNGVVINEVSKVDSSKSRSTKEGN